jgi:hypothetical protein
MANDGGRPLDVPMCVGHEIDMRCGRDGEGRELMAREGTDGEGGGI